MKPAPRAALIPSKRPKYGNRKVVVDGVTFDSVKEANRWQVLKLMERAGEIGNLKRQPRFPLMIGDALICTYIGDAAYERPPGGPLVIEDTKGFLTDIYKIKRKLMAALHSIHIEEV